MGGRIPSPPRRCTVRCPKCAKRAEFSSAYRFFKNPNASIHPMGLKFSYGSVAVRMPKKLSWKSSRNPTLQAQRTWGPGEPWGIATCGACGFAGPHKLKWPKDAYYRGTVGGKTLFAPDREFLVRLLRLIEHQKSPSNRNSPDLRAVPRIFFLKKNHDAMIKTLNRLLEL